MTITHEVVNQAPPLTGFSAADEPALGTPAAGAGFGAMLRRARTEGGAGR